MKSLCLMLFLSLFAFNSHAEHELVSQFRKAAIDFANAAKKKGYDRIDGIVLDEVIADAKTVHIVYDPHFQFSWGNRQYASWQGDIRAPNASIGPVIMRRFIRLNQAFASLRPSEMGGLAFHEISMKKDSNYASSSEILTHSSDNPIVSGLKAKEISRMTDKNNSLKSGGSTVVGGGGDLDDLLFKTSGLEYLIDFQPTAVVVGIPVELLRMALKYMKTAPSSSIKTDFELRGAGVELSRRDSILYVRSEKYRSKDRRTMALDSMMAARLYLLYAPDDLNLAEINTNIIADRTWSTSLIDVPFLVSPIDQTEFMTWENKEITATMNKEEVKQALEDAKKKADLKRKNVYPILSELYDYKVLLWSNEAQSFR